MLTFGEDPAARPLGGDGVPIDLHADLGLYVLMSDDIELLFGAIPLARETEQLKEKRTAYGIGWTGFDFGRQLINRGLQLTAVKQFFRSCHNNSLNNSYEFTDANGFCG